MPFDQQNFDPTSTDPVLRILRDAQQLLSDPSRWCKYALSLPGPAGDAYCAHGAILHTVGRDLADFFHGEDDQEAVAILGRDAMERAGLWVADFNNSPATDHADLMAWFDRAIAARIAALPTLQAA